VQLLELKNLIFCLRGDECSQPISLLLRDRDVMWVKGPSGAGKTTFLRAVARLIPFLEGDLLLEGVSWTSIPAVEWRTRVTYFHQKPVVFPGTVLSNLQRPFALKSRQRQSLDLELAADLAAQLLLPTNILSRDALTLSVGEASRVALIRGLLTGPQVLLLDEPTAALDPHARETLAETLRRWIAAGGRGIIAIAHDKEFLEMLPGYEMLLPGHSE
jgi:putative ABC transport system ATP-binding protein